mmetsp:Transcript_82556/g.267238  ORF Transcript_82556/g.267238 Transcript_82556/m.267238 type:complete len:147 (+) Transcript_82556:1078-1518(+)
MSAKAPVTAPHNASTGHSPRKAARRLMSFSCKPKAAASVGAARGPAAAPEGEEDMRTEVGIMCIRSMEFRGERRRICRGMITGSLRIVDSHIILEDSMVTGNVVLEGNSRLVLKGGMITGSVLHSATSTFENRGGLLTGLVQRSWA